MQKNKAFVSALALLLIAIGLAPSTMAQGAKSLFYRQIENPQKQDNIGLTYSIELIRDSKTALVDNRFAFASGDQLRFHVQSNIDGYLYILMKKGSRGDSGLLFPAPGSKEDNHVLKGKDISVPAKGVLEFDKVAGIEKVKLVLSPQKLIKNPDFYSRSIVITPKQSKASNSAECSIEFALKDDAKVSFQTGETPTNFSAEPAVTVVSHELNKPLSVEMDLQHFSAKGETQNLTYVDPTLSQANSSSRSANSAHQTILTSSSSRSSSDKVVADKWALVVGISEFKNPKWNLLYAAKDAQDFAEFLVKDGNFAADHVKVLVNSAATRENILTALGSKWLPENAKPGDIVVIYFATHGTGAEQDIAHKNFLLACDTDPNNTFATGIEIQDLARTIKRRLNSDRIIVVLDTCHSGSAEPGAKSLFPPETFSFADLVQGSGQLIIASASDKQTAHDSMRYKNGIFTRHFIDGLRQNKKISDAFAYTCKKVEEESKQDFRQEQTPVMKDAEWKGAGVVLVVPPEKPRKAQN